MLAKMWRKGNLLAPLVGMQTDPLGRTIRRSLKKLGTELPYDPTIPLLGIYPEKAITERDMCYPNAHYSTFYNS